MSVHSENLKKLDEFAKSLGITIYEIEYGFIKDGELADFGASKRRTLLAVSDIEIKKPTNIQKVKDPRH